ncbi:MAG: L-threonylcarbamoyladenylate synthase [Nitrospirota bacterium]
MPLPDQIKYAAAVLREGGIVAFPTETVYGLGARVFDPKAVSRIYQIKGRPNDNPLIAHIANKNQLDSLTPEVSPLAHTLIESFWPGPLTLVLKRLDTVPAIVSANLKTIAIRMPNHPVALALLSEFNEPIAAPSANRSGRVSPTSATHVREALGNDVDCILDGGQCTVGLESTVLDMTCNPPTLLRPGAITIEMIESAIGPITLAQSREQTTSSPGMNHPHYQPSCKVVLVDPYSLHIALGEHLRYQKRLGMISFQNGQCAPREIDTSLFAYARMMTDLSDYARNLFAAFHEAEEAKVEILLVEQVPKEGLGLAIMDRLQRAAGN